jgi:hypothetical protein
MNQIVTSSKKSRGGLPGAEIVNEAKKNGVVRGFSVSLETKRDKFSNLALISSCVTRRQHSVLPSLLSPNAGEILYTNKLVCGRHQWATIYDFRWIEAVITMVMQV